MPGGYKTRPYGFQERTWPMKAVGKGSILPSRRNQQRQFSKFSRDSRLNVADRRDSDVAGGCDGWDARIAERVAQSQLAGEGATSPDTAGKEKTPPEWRR